MELSDRLKLLKYLAIDRKLPAELLAEITAAVSDGTKLLEHRNVIAHTAWLVTLDPETQPEIVVPRRKYVSKPERSVTKADIDGYKDKVYALRQSMMRIASKLATFLHGAPVGAIPIKRNSAKSPE
jgi:hypothetical protein